MNAQSRRITVLYGTQTGTAQEVAERIGRESKRRWFITRVISLEHYDWQSLPSEQVVIFVVSTTGQGEVPDSMKKFWKLLLQKRLASDSLSNVQFGVFGLGDSSYPRFNFVAKRLFRRLLNLGASDIIKRGDGDDQHPLGLEGDLDPWLKELWEKLLSPSFYPLPTGKEILPSDIRPTPRYHLRILNDPQHFNQKKLNNNNQSNVYNQQHPFLAKIISNERLTALDWDQDVRVVTFDLENSQITYNPGDVVYIQPENSSEDTLEFLHYLGYDPKMIIENLEPADIDTQPMLDVSFPITLFDFAKRHLDFMGTMRRYFFELLSFFATNEMEIERLKYFASTEGQDDLRFYNNREKRTAFQVFMDFPSVKPPIEYLFDIVPRIQPRAFSISSSLKYHPNQLQITMGVVRFKTPMNRIRKGVCSTYLATSQPSIPINNNNNNNVDDEHSNRVPIWIKPGVVKLPNSLEIPLIMVGPGTGLAMFRSIIEERHYMSKKGETVGESAFFFGCRLKDKDYLHGSEFEYFVKEGTLSLFEVAFSRDKEESDKANRLKTYVQHKIKERSKDVWRLIQNGAYIYVSGSSGRMPIDVREAFAEVAQKEQGLATLEEGEEFMKQLEKAGRYQTETWS